MKLWDPRFQKEVAQKIAAIEAKTAAEIVVVLAPRAARHNDVPIFFGLIALMATLTLLVFVDEEVADYTLYIAPFGACIVVAGLASIAPGLLRLGLGRTRRRVSTEIMARATFQKAGLSRTRDRTGILVFATRLEGCASVVRDDGAAVALSADEWVDVETRFNGAAKGSDGGDAFLGALDRLGEHLAARLPPRPDDVDELPSFVEVAF